MAVLLFRIDDRLIHGQVVEGWFPYLHPDRVVVADDEAAASAFQRSLMELVVPYEVATEIVSLAELVARQRAGGLEPGRAVVLFRVPRSVVTALDLGLALERVNLGGLHARGAVRTLGRGIAVSEEDLRDLREILAAGVRVEVRAVPSDPAVELGPLLAAGAQGG